ncbi:hypothetical protein D5S18_18540 [Nocardia panacis]|uniref:Uncharacterized protein n=1 Tax=Nocardia panacis TaxID=2340916 RepID=A0A3A4KEU6_9NOCA|nr:DUF6221 family protein [Nocardia panacis]RJO74152.1 hypothetical protein D5S18_18540 [Nocardia panacis]
MTADEFAEDEAAAKRSVRWNESCRDWADNGDPDWVHIARHDPARVLRHAAAARRILSRYAEAEREALLSERDSGYATGMYGALEYLAATWSDHADYQNEWK